MFYMGGHCVRGKSRLVYQKRWNVKISIVHIFYTYANFVHYWVWDDSVVVWNNILLPSPLVLNAILYKHFTILAGVGNNIMRRVWICVNPSDHTNRSLRPPTIWDALINKNIDSRSLMLYFNLKIYGYMHSHRPSDTSTFGFF